MTEKEYQEILELVADEYLRLNLIKELSPSHIQHMKILQTISWIASGVKPHSNNSKFVKTLDSIVGEAEESSKILVDLFEQSGVLEAMEVYGSMICSNYYASYLPPEDMDILRDSGIKNSKAFMTLIEARAKHLSSPIKLKKEESLTSDLLRIHLLSAFRNVYSQQVSNFEQSSDSSKQSSIKRIVGVTRVCAGGALGIGNVLLGVGMLPSTVPFGAGAVLQSCATSIMFISAGLESLTGDK